MLTVLNFFFPSASFPPSRYYQKLSVARFDYFINKLLAKPEQLSKLFIVSLKQQIVDPALCYIENQALYCLSDSY